MCTNVVVHTTDWPQCISFAAISRWPFHCFQFTRNWANLMGLSRLVLVEILLRNIVLQHLVCIHFSLVRIVALFDPCHYAGLKDVTFFHQFLDALRV